MAILGAVPIALLIVWWIGTLAKPEGAGFVLIYGVVFGALSLPFVAILGAAAGAAAHAIAVKRQLPLTPMVIGAPLLAVLSIGVLVVVAFSLFLLICHSFAVALLVFLIVALGGIAAIIALIRRSKGKGAGHANHLRNQRPPKA